MENVKPTSGTITFEKGKIIEYNFTGGVSITAYNCGASSENEILDVLIPNTINGKK